MVKIIWKEEILPLIFYITSELNLSVEYKFKETKPQDFPIYNQ